MRLGQQKIVYMRSDFARTQGCEILQATELNHDASRAGFGVQEAARSRADRLSGSRFGNSRAPGYSGLDPMELASFCIEQTEWVDVNPLSPIW